MFVLRFNMTRVSQIGPFMAVLACCTLADLNAVIAAPNSHLNSPILQYLAQEADCSVTDLVDYLIEPQLTTDPVAAHLGSQVGASPVDLASFLPG
jgi:hypothetical protein